MACAVEVTNTELRGGHEYRPPFLYRLLLSVIGGKADILNQKKNPAEAGPRYLMLEGYFIFISWYFMAVPFDSPIPRADLTHLPSRKKPRRARAGLSQIDTVRNNELSPIWVSGLLTHRVRAQCPLSGAKQPQSLYAQREAIGVQRWLVTKN